MWRSATLLMMVAGVTAAAAPSKGDVGKALKKTLKDVKSVSQVFADLGDGRFPVLFVTRGRDCIERTIEKEKEESCSPTTVPHAAILKRDAKGELQVEAELALPTAATPWDQSEELKWGITNVKDYDGDGRPELLVIYGYHGPMVWAVGDVYYRDLCLLNLDKLGEAMHVTLDEKPEASVNPDIETKFKFAAGEIQLTRKVGDYDDAKSERVYKESKVVWKWDAGEDKFVEVKPAKK